MKTMFQYLAAAFLFVAAYDANAQFSFRSYQGTLTIHHSVADQCPFLAQGDQVPITVLVQFGDAIFRRKMDLGDYGFTTTTSSGVPVSGVGRLVADYRSGTLYISELTIGDPAGEHCYLIGLNLKVGVKAL